MRTKIGFDTNLLVRTVIADQAEQVAIVRKLIDQHHVFISRTVLLETEWVLRTIYKKSRAELLYFFSNLLSLNYTEVEDAVLVS